ncbi:MAG: flagellar motor protein [Steroidobacteraceae bacterium]
MRKQSFDILSVVGLVLACVSLMVGAVLKGAGLSALLSSAAFMIVMVGTVAAICLQTPLHVMSHAVRISGWVLRPPALQADETLKQFMEWSGVARKQGLLGLEPVLNDISDDFLRKGLQILVDGGEPEEIRAVMEVELEIRETVDMRAAKVFEGMGIYAPTLGIIGAVLGLIAVMQNLADPSKLGHGIAAAFTATIYGIGLANLLFLPMANKLKAAIHAQAQNRAMIIEGLIGIAQGENPRTIETKLQGYLH